MIAELAGPQADQPVEYFEVRHLRGRSRAADWHAERRGKPRLCIRRLDDVHGTTD
jgi:hypothetical protein